MWRVVVLIVALIVDMIVLFLKLVFGAIGGLVGMAKTASIESELSDRTKIKNILKHDKYNSNAQGVFFGKLENKKICKKTDEDGHILVVGGAGSGKTSCIAIPTLATWGKRIFAIDIKGDLSTNVIKNTPRKEIIVIDPLNSKSIGYNPLYKLSDTDILQVAREIALVLLPLRPDVKEPFWITSAQNLLTGLIIYFSEQGEDDIINIFDAIQSVNIKKVIYDVSISDSKSKIFLNQFNDLKEQTYISIYSEISNTILPIITDVNLRRIMQNKSYITPPDIEHKDIYLKISETNIDKWRNFTSLVLDQFLRYFETRTEKQQPPILFLVDEFPRIGKVDNIISGLTTLRSKNICICLVIQSLAQLDNIYSKSNRQIILDNCTYKAILSATDADTQEYFSKLIGTSEQIKTSISKASTFSSVKNLTTEEKRIIKPEELAYLKSDLLLITPDGFVKLKKIPYYIENQFLMLPPPEEITAKTTAPEEITAKTTAPEEITAKTTAAEEITPDEELELNPQIVKIASITLGVLFSILLIWLIWLATDFVVALFLK